MAETVAPEFVRFIAEERRASRLSAAPRPLAEGQTSQPVFLDAGRAIELTRVAARRAVGWFRPTKRTEVVWVQGDSELAVVVAEIDIKLADGLMIVLLPVRCDQIGPATIEIFFATGAPRDPAGLFASTYRRPNGPPVIVEAWGEALVAFAWQCVLGLLSGVAGATGKDKRGNILVPVEFTATGNGLEITPMARHRFAGSSGLATAHRTRGAR
jgi:hypothetical protein